MIAKKSKGQISIEVLTIIIFLTLFIYTYSLNAENLVEIVEVANVKNQQQDILLSLREFISYQEMIAKDDSLTVFDSIFEIPSLSLASSRTNCVISFRDNDMVVYSNHDFGTVENSLAVKTLNVILPSEKHCGKDLVCSYNKNELLVKCT